MCITLDAIEYAALADVIVLVSGDRDFDLLPQKFMRCMASGSRVYGVTKLTAHSLINAASQLIPIEGNLLLGWLSFPRKRGRGRASRANPF
ncbi:NYN domain-containing protein [Salinicola lusitanus]|uniref:NYN domain-containing protein n=1 Tax=Salinicola lusitanus TaxID=1949085 RepID=A0ABZ3CTE3_9GAMM